MTSTTRAGLPTLLLVLACGMGVRAPVAAATSAQDPTMCTRWGLNTASGVYQLDGSTGFGGIEDDIGHGTDFVCPLVRTQEPGPQGMRVTLTGGFGAMYCMLFSNSYQGAPIGSVGGYLDSLRYPSLTLPQSLVPPWSAQSLYCMFSTEPPFTWSVSSIRIDL